MDLEQLAIEVAKDLTFLKTRDKDSCTYTLISIDHDILSKRNTLSINLNRKGGQI